MKVLYNLDSRLRGNDIIGSGNDIRDCRNDKKECENHIGGDYSRSVIFVSNSRLAHKVDSILNAQFQQHYPNCSFLAPLILPLDNFAAHVSFMPQIVQAHTLVELAYLAYAPDIKTVADLSYYVEKVKSLDQLLLYLPYAAAKEHLPLSSDDPIIPYLALLPNCLNQRHIAECDAEVLTSKYTSFFYVADGHSTLLDKMLLARFGDTLRQIDNITLDTVPLQSVRLNFSSKTLYPAAIAELLLADVDCSYTILIDDPLLSDLTYQTLLNQGFSVQDICFRRPVNQDKTVQDFINLAELIFEEVNLHKFLSIIATPTFRHYHAEHYSMRQPLHGREVNVQSFADLLLLFPQHSALIEQLQEYRQKVQHNISFKAKTLLLFTAFAELCDPKTIKTLALYKFEEKILSLHISHLNNNQYLTIFNYYAHNTTYDNTNAEAKIVICSSNTLHVEPGHTLLLVDLELSNLLEKSNVLLRPFESKGANVRLTEFRHAIAQSETLYYFSNLSDLTDSIKIELLEIDFSEIEESLENQLINHLKPNSASVWQEPSIRAPVGLVIDSITPTAFRLLLHNPFEYYIRHILRVQETERFNEFPFKKNIGIACHRILAQFTNTLPANVGEFNIFFKNQLWAFLDQSFNDFHWLLLQPKLDEVGNKLLSELSYQKVEVKTEAPISTDIIVNNRVIRLHARADRIEYSDNSINIIDFKTGRLPTPSEVRNLLDPQLLLEAYILRQHDKRAIAVKILGVFGKGRNVVVPFDDDLHRKTEELVHNTIIKYFVEEAAEFESITCN